MIKAYLEYNSEVVDSHPSKYDNFLLIGDCSSVPNEEAMKSLWIINNFKNYFKNLHAKKASAVLRVLI